MASIDDLIAQLPFLTGRNSYIEPAEPVHTGASFCRNCPNELLHNINNEFICLRCNVVHGYGEDFSLAVAPDDHYNGGRIKVVGGTSHQYSKTIFAGSNYTDARNRLTMKEFNKINFNAGNPLPQQVLLQAVELFQSVQDQGFVFRGQVRKGVMASCAQYACIGANLMRVTSEFAKIFNVTEKHIHAGEKKLLNLSAAGKIKFVLAIPNHKLVDGYMTVFGVNEFYKPFIVDLLELMTDPALNKVKSTIKVIGVLQLLMMATMTFTYKMESSDHPAVMRIKQNPFHIETDPSIVVKVFTMEHFHELVASNINMNRLHYGKFTSMLIAKRRQLKPAFTQHGIPYPVKMESERGRKKKRYQFRLEKDKPFSEISKEI